MFKTKEQVKTSEDELNGAEKVSLPKREFKAMTVKMFKELGRRFNKQHKKFSVQNLKM